VPAGSWAVNPQLPDELNLQWRPEHNAWVRWPNPRQRW
jgi:hypothetical protein